jgi:molybdenum cofactor biosynthesis enzyme MoaA
MLNNSSNIHVDHSVNNNYSERNEQCRASDKVNETMDGFNANLSAGLNPSQLQNVAYQNNSKIIKLLLQPHELSLFNRYGYPNSK